MYRFLLFFTLYLKAIFQVQSPWGQFNRGFFALQVWGTLYIFGGGAYFFLFLWYPIHVHVYVPTVEYS